MGPHLQVAWCPPAQELESHLYEELQPAAVVARRGEPGAVEYLVRWGDGEGATWEPERHVADDVVADYDAGLEYAPASGVLRRRRGPGGAQYLVAWDDGQQDCWLDEGCVALDLLRAHLDAAAEADGRRAARKSRAHVAA